MGFYGRCQQWCHTAQTVQRVHRLNRKINVWTANAEEDIRRLMNWGVDGIITDDPIAAVRVVKGPLP